MFRTQQIDPPVLLLIEMLPARSAAMSSDDGAPVAGSKAISTTRHDAAKYQRFFNTIHEHFCASGVQCPVGGKGDLSGVGGMTTYISVLETESTEAPVWVRSLHAHKRSSPLKERARSPRTPRGSPRLTEFDIKAESFQVGDYRPSNLSYACAAPSRIGAFEVYLVSRYGSESPRCELLHSKLLTGTWPRLADLVQSVEGALIPFWADSALLPAASQKVQEHSELEAQIEIWQGFARPQTLSTARTRLSSLAAADEEVMRLMEADDVEGMRAVVGVRDVSRSLLPLVHQRLSDFESSTRMLQRTVNTENLNQEDIDRTLSMFAEASSTRGESTLWRTAAEAKLVEMRAADVALRAAIKARPVERAVMQAAMQEHGKKASAAVRAEMSAALELVEAADAQLLRWRWSVKGQAPYEAKELAAALEQHGHMASASVLDDLVDIQAADDALRKALAVKPLEASDLQAVMDAQEARASTSVCLHVQRQLNALRVADLAIRSAIARVPLERHELAMAVRMHAEGSSASVVALAPPVLRALEAADMALSKALVTKPLEASELQTSLSKHGPGASVSTAQLAESRLRELRMADAALVAAMAKLPVEAHELTSAITAYAASASASVVQALTNKADDVRLMDAAVRALIAAPPLEAAEVRAGLDARRTGASASVVATVVYQLAELDAADEALQAVLARKPVEAEDLDAAFQRLRKGASGSVAEAVQKKLAEVQAADATLRLASAQRPVEAAPIKRALSMCGAVASASVRAEVERQLEGLEAEDAELRALVAKLPDSFSILKEAIEQRRGSLNPGVSHSELEAALGALQKVGTCSDVLRMALAAKPLEASELQTSLSKHGPGASTEITLLVESRLRELRMADAALVAAMAKLPVEAHELTSAITAYAASASASVVQALTNKADDVRLMDAAVRALIAAPPLEAAEVRAGLDAHRTGASASVVATVVHQLEDLDAADEAIRAILSLPPSHWRKLLESRPSDPEPPEGMETSDGPPSSPMSTQSGLVRMPMGNLSKMGLAEVEKSAALLCYADLSAAASQYGPRASRSMRTAVADMALSQLLLPWLGTKGEANEYMLAALELHGQYATEPMIVRLLEKWRRLDKKSLELGRPMLERLSLGGLLVEKGPKKKSWTHLVYDKVTAGFQTAFGEVTDKSDAGLDAAFAMVDTNKSGKIDAAELKAYFQSVYGKELDDQTINEMMTTADIDEDGEVSLAEFKTIMRASKIPVVSKAAPVSKGSKWKKAAGTVAAKAKPLNSLAAAAAAAAAAATTATAAASGAGVGTTESDQTAEKIPTRSSPLPWSESVFPRPRSPSPSLDLWVDPAKRTPSPNSPRSRSRSPSKLFGEEEAEHAQAAVAKSAAEAEEAKAEAEAQRVGAVESGVNEGEEEPEVPNIAANPLNSPPPSTPAASSNGNSPPDRADSLQRSSPQRSSPDRTTSGMPASDGITEQSLFEPAGVVEQSAAIQPVTVDAVGNTDELVQRAEAPVQRTGRHWQQWTQQVAASNALVKQLPLPEGWRQGMAPNGSEWIPYYYNTSTGKTQWERPYEQAVAAGPSNVNRDKGATALRLKKPAPERTEWRQARAPNGLTYYYNSITNATQWEPPT